MLLLSVVWRRNHLLSHDWNFAALAWRVIVSAMREWRRKEKQCLFFFLYSLCYICVLPIRRSSDVGKTRSAERWQQHLEVEAQQLSDQMEPLRAKYASLSWFYWANRLWGSPRWCCVLSKDNSMSTRRAQLVRHFLHKPSASMRRLWNSKSGILLVRKGKIFIL